jgi:SAM-dependent methyltransferase
VRYKKDEPSSAGGNERVTTSSEPFNSVRNLQRTLLSRLNTIGFFHVTVLNTKNFELTMTASTESQETNVAWFDAHPTESQISQESRSLLENYSGLSPGDVFKHVVEVRDEAWKIFPYPCIGQFRFLEAGLTDCEEYGEVIERLQKGQKLLDMACCFGQTIRHLVADGAPSENIYGCDLQSDFIELGYKLFQDRDKIRAKFLIADIFDASSPLKDHERTFDIVYTGSFFHLWGLQKQKEVSKAVALLLCPRSGSMIIGRQIGALEAAEKSSATGTMFRHNPESLKTLWKEIGDDLGMKFTVEAHLKALNDHHFEGGDTRRIYFSIRRE